MLTLKDGTKAEPGMLISDVNGIYEIQYIDEYRRLCSVREVYVDEGGMVYPVGQSWFRTFPEIRKCERW